MTRRDIIIVAALVNAGLLAVLFMLATNSEDDKVSEPTELSQTVLEISPSTATSEPTVVALSNPQNAPNDEVDNALKEYSANPSPQQVILEDDILSEQDDSSEAPITPEAPVITPEEEPVGKVVEVTVKRGDSLDRIARANKSSVQSIRDANNLKNDRLNIGQVLKVPVTSKKSAAPAATASTKAPAKKSDAKAVASTDTAGAQYYTIKSGDNPWKIAKQFKIKVDDLLKLNNMSEEKARNMKVGDRVRVK